jgi:hypothetical protein
MVVYGLLSTYTALPNPVAFGSQPIHVRSAPMTVTVTNTGTTALLIKSIFLSSTGPDYFRQTNNCGNSVAVGSGCAITVYFVPTATGPAQATLTVNTGTIPGSQVITLSGTGS